MENKFNEATRQRPEGDRVMDAPVVEINIPAFIRQIKDEEKWKGSDRNAITVFKTGSMQVVLVAMHKGAAMKEHSAKCLMSLLVIEGLLLFTAHGKTAELKKGQMIALHGNIPHALSAKEETVFLLTLAGEEV